MPYPLQSKWAYKAVPNLLGGIDKSKQPDALADNQCVTLKNVKIKDGMIVSDSGFAIYGTADSWDGNFEYPLQSIHQFNRRDGTSELIAITTVYVYKYKSSMQKWFPVPGALYTTTTAAYAAGATVFAIALDPGFSVSDAIAIDLDNGNLHYANITAIAGLNITIGLAIAAGRTVANGARFFKPKTLTGVVSKLVSAVTVPGSDWMVFTNGVNLPQRWNGTTCEYVPGTSSYICRAVALYNTALFLLGTTEGGVSYPQRARRSNQTDPTDWTGGTAGYDDLLDSSDAVMCAALLGPYLIVYKSRSIIRCSFIGSSGLNYQYETVVTHEGAITPLSVVTVKDHHVFVGHNNIYEYAGDFTIKPIGDQIRPTLFGPYKDVNTTYDYMIFALYIEALDEVWVFYPHAAATGAKCNYGFRYKVDTGVWYDLYYVIPINGGSVFRSENEEGELNFQLYDASYNASVIYNPTKYTTQYGSAISFTVETKDFIMPDGRFRVDMVEMNIQGTSVLLEYSTDGGTTYTTMATITQATQIKIRVHKQFVCDRVRFRWTGTASNFKLSWFGFSYKIENLYTVGSNVY